MATLVGLVLALLTVGFARAVGLDRERAFYPVLLIFIGSYYVLFAAIAGKPTTFSIETLLCALFVIIASLAFTRSRWLVVFGLLGHGLFDAVHAQVIDNPGVPGWWPPFCLSFDVALALSLAVIFSAARDVRSPTEGRDPKH